MEGTDICELFFKLIRNSGIAETGWAGGADAPEALALILCVLLVFKFRRRLKAPVLLLFVPTAAFALFTLALFMQKASFPDTFLYGALSGLITENRTALMKLATNMGSFPVLVTVTVALLAALRFRKKSLFYGKAAAVNLAAAALLNFLLKNLFRRARPDVLPLVHAGGYSYPSGHSMISAAFYGYLLYLCAVRLKRPWRRVLPAALALLILAIGISRVYLGVHYASDVIGGFLAGFAWLVLFIAWTKLRRDRPRAKEGIKRR